MKFKNQHGFTLIEILMVLLLVAILSAVAMNAFINFRTEARNAALQANLAALRAGIMSQYAQMQLRCGTNSGTFPALASLIANDITDGNSTCTVGMVTVASERQFVMGGIPANPWSSTLSTDINASADSVIGDATFCNGTTTALEEWCYEAASGRIWLDSATATREAM